MSKEYFIYLGGPIEGLSFAGATDWRDAVSLQLHPCITPLSPMRWKPELREAGVINRESVSNAGVITGGRAITLRDRFDVRRADLLLFNFAGANKSSMGSAIEIGWGDAWGKPMVAVMDPGSVFDHPMITDIVPIIVPTLAEAVDLVHRILLPEPVRSLYAAPEFEFHTPKLSPCAVACLADYNLDSREVQALIDRAGAEDRTAVPVERTPQGRIAGRITVPGFAGQAGS